MIPFTQYLLPDGRRKETGVDRPEKIETLARQLLDRGVHFDAEVLRTGEVSLTAELDSLDDPILAIEVVPNGPEVPLAVDRLVSAAYGEI